MTPSLRQGEPRVGRLPLGRPRGSDGTTAPADGKVGGGASSVSLYADAAQRPARTSVTLIDLRAETGDLEQIGFKVCDRITRHPSLRRATRPEIWSDVHTAANLQYARGVGAVAVVDDEWVDSGDDAPDAPLVDVPRWAWAQPTERHAHARVPRVFPRDSSSVEAEERERRERFERWFGYPPSDLDLGVRAHEAPIGDRHAPVRQRDAGQGGTARLGK
jgi:hypothetical protein